MSPTAVLPGRRPGVPGTDSEAGPTGSRLASLVTPRHVGVALVVLAGVALRVFILGHSLGVLDSDEATTGLVARHILHNHEHPVFYWSSNYGGTIEAAATAVAFAVLGSSVVVLKVMSVLWYAVACVLVWRVGIRLVDERAGLVAALLMWVWPGTYVWWTTKSRGFYGAGLVFGLIVALYALRLADNPKRRADWLVLGLALGLGWWTTPQIMLLAVPAGLWMLVRNWRAALGCWLALPTFVLGAFPWILWNVRHPLDSLKADPTRPGDTYVGLLTRFWREALPIALGARVPYTLRWIVGNGNRLYVLGLLIAAAGLVWGTWRHHRRGGLLLAIGLLVYPFLYALNPLANVTSEARYLFMLSPVIALTIAFCAHRAWVGAALLGVAIALSTLSLTTMHNGASPFASDRSVPLDVMPLVRTMQAQGVRTGFADYWIAERVDFESAERVTLVGAPYNRYPPYDTKVRNDPRPPAWIFVSGSVADHHFHDAVDAMHEPYRLIATGGFSLYLPEHKLLPGQVPSF